MEKKRMRLISVGGGQRLSFSHQKEVLEMPNLIDVQKVSHQWFISEGLTEVFHDVSPIEDYGGKYSLEFLSFSLGEPKYTIAECKERDATFSAPMNVKVRLHNKEKDEVTEREIFMGEMP
ncbi:MAG TPA: hypothetical protein DEO62_02755, partial [Lachnospiraceae bacterium]|nr:hypothetical protein [Lachnospiraceae bacterium]